MSDWLLNTPVAFIIFNRPDTTARVFAEIAKAKPAKLLVVADGPRKGRVGEAEKCAETRAIINQVDWPCEVLTNYSEVNLGCKSRVSSGIDWVFEQVEEAIILEDDCLPDPTFFRFCQEMLERYRHDKRVGMISGDNFQFGEYLNNDSYYFSRYMHIWGWATWRRAWANYDANIRGWPAVKELNFLRTRFTTNTELRYWTRLFQLTYENKIDTWDYQWFFCLITQSQLSILPRCNLISNIGFGVDATHTKIVSKCSTLKITSLEYPLFHPEFLICNHIADSRTANHLDFKTSIIKKILIHYLDYFDCRVFKKIKKYNLMYKLINSLFK